MFSSKIKYVLLTTASFFVLTSEALSFHFNPNKISREKRGYMKGYDYEYEEQGYGGGVIGPVYLCGFAGSSPEEFSPNYSKSESNSKGSSLSFEGHYSASYSEPQKLAPISNSRDKYSQTVIVQSSESKAQNFKYEPPKDESVEDASIETDEDDKIVFSSSDTNLLENIATTESPLNETSLNSPVNKTSKTTLEISEKKSEIDLSNQNLSLNESIKENKTFTESNDGNYKDSKKQEIEIEESNKVISFPLHYILQMREKYFEKYYSSTTTSTTSTSTTTERSQHIATKI